MQTINFKYKDFEYEVWVFDDRAELFLLIPDTVAGEGHILRHMKDFEEASLDKKDAVEVCKKWLEWIRGDK